MKWSSSLTDFYTLRNDTSQPFMGYRIAPIMFTLYVFTSSITTILSKLKRKVCSP